jgi:DNA primase
VIAFGGRVVGQGEPKYLNSTETPIFQKSANLYAIEKAKAAIVASGVAVVVEGYTDVIALHEGGVANAVATLGTALTRRTSSCSEGSPERWSTCSTATRPA